MTPPGLTCISVVSVRPSAQRGRLIAGSRSLACALGQNGICTLKMEGDGATPAGTFGIRGLLFRSDRLHRPETGLPVRALRPDDGWCDDAASPFYNRLVHRPLQYSAETMWRDDSIYDLVVILGINDRPVVPGRGSALFLHIARDGYAPTQGCVAVARSDLLALLPALRATTRIAIRRGPASPLQKAPITRQERL